MLASGIDSKMHQLCTMNDTPSTVKVPSLCCDLSCDVAASCGRSGIACSWPGVVLRSHKLGIGLL